ncbi:enolase C-terminal domain-like protein [Candidatus Latescibacterota bacterium]
MNRRDVMKSFAMGTAAGASSFIGGHGEAVAQTYSKAIRGLPPLTITNVKTILTAPDKIRLVVVKVETSEPGLYGLGCALFELRPLITASAVNNYIKPFAEGKNADNIEDMWQTAYVSSYWRNGSVLNNAMSGLDMALWDIKGKRANMPVYQLLGGKCRFAVPSYVAIGGNPERIREYMENGFKYFRLGFGSPQPRGRKPHYKEAGFGSPADNYFHMDAASQIAVKTFDNIRNTIGDEVELILDVHEKLYPNDAINLCKQLEQYRPFFIEDPLAPEDNGYFRLLREQTSVPIGMGELYNNPHEWTGLITDRLIDYIRVHISHIGGITPAMKLARLCEWFNVRSAWHTGSGIAPVAIAANAHIDLAIWNFGIQEQPHYGPETVEVFPGSPELKKGYLYVNDAPGLGVDIDEKLAARFPYPDDNTSGGAMQYYWNSWRKEDGTPIRP